MKINNLIALFAVLLLLNGCNSDAQTDACRYYVQQDLDETNYDSAIKRLDNLSCQQTYPENEFYVDLGTAYIGKSGLTLPQIISAMIKDENNEDNEDNEDNKFAYFIKKITDSATDSALQNLDDSSHSFDRYLQETKCKNITAPTNTEKGICLLKGVVDILKTTLAVYEMSGGKVDEWIEKSDGKNPYMLRASCALKYAFDHKYDSEFLTPYNKCSKGTEIDSIEFVTFTASDNTTKDYNSLAVSFQGDIDYFLESETQGTTIFTKNYCLIDYQSCDNPSIDGCFACPLEQKETDLNTQDYLLNALNSGFDNIQTLITNAGVDNSDELQTSLNEFKEEIKPGGCEQVAQGEDCFTMDDILNYLNKE